MILIFVYLIREGTGAVNLNFFTRVPAPEGEAGGGLLNAIVGSLSMLGMASVFGVLIGIAGGIFLASTPGTH